MTVTITKALSAEAVQFKQLTGTLLPSLQETDLFVHINKHICEMSEETAISCLQTASEMRGFNAFLMGGVLRQLQKNNWHAGYSELGFKAFVIEKLGMASSTAYDYMNIYDALISSEVEWVDIKHVGWTKIRVFAKYLTKDNADGWIQEAEKRNTKELKELSKCELQAAQKGNSKLSKPQIVEESTHADSDVVSDFPGSDVDSAGDQVEQVKSFPLVSDEVAASTPCVMKFKLYPEDKELVDDALALVKSETDYKSDGAALGLVCMAFLSTEYAFSQKSDGGTVISNINTEHSV